MVSLLRRTQYGAYNTAKQTASKTRQVVMLYDGVIRFVQQAKQAIEEKRFEDRFHLLRKASEVVVGLQGSLDFDNGEEVSQQLFDFYSTIDTQLTVIHRTNSLEGCDQVVESLKTMRDEWHRIDTLQENRTELPPVSYAGAASEALEATVGEAEEGSKDSSATATAAHVPPSRPQSAAASASGIHISA